MEPKTAYTAVDKADLEELIRAWNDKLIEATDKWRFKETAKEAHDEAVRPIVKKLNRFVELWEEVDEKEKAAENATAFSSEFVCGA